MDDTRQVEQTIKNIYYRNHNQARKYYIALSKLNNKYAIEITTESYRKCLNNIQLCEYLFSVVSNIKSLRIILINNVHNNKDFTSQKTYEEFIENVVSELNNSKLLANNLFSQIVKM
jgi:hypothetical protein